MNSKDFSDQKRSGRPRIHRVEDIESIQKKNRLYSALDIKHHWTNNSPPSKSTINNIKKKLGVKERKRRLRHHLTEKEKNLRVKIAIKHQGKLKKRRAVFFDETCCDKQFLNARSYIFPKEHVEEMEIINGKGLKGHFAGAISYHFKSDLYFYKKKMNGDEYQKVIDNYIIDDGDRHYGWNDRYDRRDWYLYQDGDSTHTSKSTKDYLESRGIVLWDRVAWSPDMAPIEYIWSIFWFRVGKMCPKNDHELEVFGKKVWKEISQTEIRNTIDKLDEIYQQIIDTKGEYFCHTFAKN